MIKFKLHTFILTGVLLILFNINSTFAEKKCSISETPEIINTYIKNTHKVVSNVNKLVKERYKPNKTNSKFPKTDESVRIIRSFQGQINRLFTWKGYETNLEYLIQENNEEIPKEVRRDIIILHKESVNIGLINLSGLDIEVKGSEICKGVDNCNFDQNKNYKAIEIIRKLKQSTNQIKNLIKNQTNDFQFKDDIKIYFIKKEDIEKIYSKENIKNCNLSENNGKKGFFATIKSKIKNILSLDKLAKEGMNDWNTAVKLLWGTNDDYKEIERNLLAKELAKQGIGGTPANAIIGNLEGYNNSKKTENPFLKGKAGFLDSLQIQIDEFEEALEKSFPGYKKGNPANNIVSGRNITNEIRKLKNIKLSQININSEYQKLKSISLDENINNEQLVNQVIDIHISVSEMINTLHKTCPIAVKVCNSQKRGLGNCGQCN